jgi:hypothetical protein
MKKIILFGLIGALALFVGQYSSEVQAMDGGMMGAAGYRGHDMGSGMMGYDVYRPDGMGYGMMGAGGDSGSLYRQDHSYLDRKGAERIFQDYLKSSHNPELRLGKIKDDGNFFEAEILNQDNSPTEKLIVEKNIGQMCSTVN